MAEVSPGRCARAVLASKLAVGLEPSRTRLPTGSVELIGDPVTATEEHLIGRLAAKGRVGNRGIMQLGNTLPMNEIQLHQWLFLNTLDSVAALRRHVAFYVAAHNAQVPHSAFRGQTPDEMYFGTSEQVPAELASAKSAALEARLTANRMLSCERCARVPMGTDRIVSAAA